MNTENKEIKNLADSYISSLNDLNAELNRKANDAKHVRDIEVIKNKYEFSIEALDVAS